MSITFYTRSNDGQVHDHFEDLASALEYFTSDTGYRIDFYFSDGSILHIHRAEYNEDISDTHLAHPYLKQYNQAIAKVLFYQAEQKQKSDNNVIQVDFS